MKGIIGGLILICVCGVSEAQPGKGNGGGGNNGNGNGGCPNPPCGGPNAVPIDSELLLFAGLLAGFCIKYSTKTKSKV